MSGRRRTTGSIGAYVGEELKAAIQTEAKSEHRTLSQQVTRILDLHTQGKDAEREACVSALCGECLTNSAEFHPLRRQFVHYTDDDKHTHTVCAASAIHKRTMHNQESK